MNSLAYIPASDGAANASLMTVTNVRAPGATTLQVNTVANAPTKFYASMGTPNTFTDPVTGETITVISEATAVDFAGTIDGSNVEIVEIAPGYTDSGSEVGDIIIIRPVTEWANNIFNVLSQAHNDDGTLKDDSVKPGTVEDGAVAGVNEVDANGWYYNPKDGVYYYVQNDVPTTTLNGNGTAGDQKQWGNTILPPVGHSDFKKFSVTVTIAGQDLGQAVASVRTGSSQADLVPWIRNVYSSSPSVGPGKISAIAKKIIE